MINKVIIKGHVQMMHNLKFERCATILQKIFKYTINCDVCSMLLNH